MKKLRQMAEEEEKMRIPVAQGLPWTTDEPEVTCCTCLLKLCSVFRVYMNRLLCCMSDFA